MAVKRRLATMTCCHHSFERRDRQTADAADIRTEQAAVERICRVGCVAEETSVGVFDDAGSRVPENAKSDPRVNPVASQAGA